MLRRYGFRLKRIARADTVQDTTERAVRQAAAKRVTAEIQEHFPVLNAENCSEAEAYRAQHKVQI